MQSKKNKKHLFDTTIEMVSVKKLIVNPYQGQLFSGETSSPILEHMKASIKKYGVKTPLKITADDIIIGGHRRLAIAKELKLKQVPCQRARYELSPSELKLHLIEDNFLQRSDSSKRRKVIFTELLVLIRDQFDDWEELIRQHRTGLIEKIQDTTGVSMSTARKISKSERTRARRLDNASEQGIVHRDKTSLFKSVATIRSIMSTTSKKTAELLWPEIDRLAKDMKKLVKG